MERTRTALVAAVLAALVLSRRRARRALRRVARAAGRRARYLQGQARGVLYRLSGRHPADDVGDDVLTARVRSSLGPVEKRLDIPHVHVNVFDRIAQLHGVVPDVETHERIMDAVMAVAGVEGVHSFLHVGMRPGDSRPSEGRAVAEPSAARRALVDAARSAGAAQPAHAARAVLATFMARIPESERRHMETHLPEDARALLAPPLSAGAQIHDLRELVETVQGTGGLTGSTNPTAVVEAVVGALRDLVPEEARDVAAVLPENLRRFWERA
ncbi:MAG TPA: DUF2267 domain-containing protein [Acidimicrobiia bacterium]|nr:DUF2267 domain-containing protein [Acidimicrobiia bacterium]